MKVLVLTINPLDIFSYEEYVSFLEEGEDLFKNNDIESSTYIDNLKMMLTALEQREQYEWCSITKEKIDSYYNNK